MKFRRLKLSRIVLYVAMGICLSFSLLIINTRTVARPPQGVIIDDYIRLYSERNFTSKSPWTSRVCTESAPWLVPWKSQLGEDRQLFTQIYKQRICRGTFLEIGALDGLTYSNTYAYERSFNWKGLLIEAQPENAAKLKINRPNVHTVHSATCFPNQTSVMFAGSEATGGNVDTLSNRSIDAWKIDTSKSVQVPCAPLSKLIANAGISAIDMFTLDVEGGEFEVLKTMNWSVPVGIWIVELDNNNPKKDNNVRLVLNQNGYRELLIPQMHKLNTIFVNLKYLEHIVSLLKAV